MAYAHSVAQSTAGPGSVVLDERRLAADADAAVSANRHEWTGPVVSGKGVLVYQLGKGRMGRPQVRR
jgi:hypothetical protein